MCLAELREQGILGNATPLPIGSCDQNPLRKTATI